MFYWEILIWQKKYGMICQKGKEMTALIIL